ncbi:MAG: hypothetical protein LUG16_03410 [Candidatus Gastranaerophilales bacterium]|nr:hypothetical protein [Candidatus Gastranaerophilales bacterium]
MIEKSIHKLKIDSKFETLIPPLSADEFKALEESIKNDGCREPICAWNKTIIDGHNRYKICSANNIPFYIQEINFDSKDEAINWICINQLVRKNISDKTRRYLIGKRYEAEKIINAKKNPKGRNQYTVELNKIAVTNTDIAIALGKEYNIASVTVRKYASYAKLVDNLLEKNPKIIPGIFNEIIKISYESMKQLTKKNKTDVHTLTSNIVQSNEEMNSRFIDSRKDLKKDKILENIFKVKETPVYDPDADISSLTYTISAWISSIERTFSLVDFEKITDKARSKINIELNKLKDTIDIMLEATEKKND